MRVTRLLISSMGLLCTLMFAQTNVAGNVSGVWSSRNSPYRLTGNVLVPVGDTLRIEPGTLVRAAGAYEFRVAGVLLASDSRLTGGSGFFIDGGQAFLSHSRIDSVTDGLKNHGGQAELEKCTLEYINQVGVTFSSGSGSVRNSTIQMCGKYGIKLTTSPAVVVTGNTLVHNSQSGLNYPALFIDSCSPDSIFGNQITDNRAQGIGVWVLTEAASPRITRNLIRWNLTGITIVNATPYLRDNIIVANYVVGNSNSGAGIYIGFPAANAVCTGNLIAGNFYGISIINSGRINLGDLNSATHTDDGGNILANNTFGGATWDVWNGTGNEILAQNNTWLSVPADSIDYVLYDDNEDVANGAVTYLPTAGVTLTRGDANQDEVINVLDVAQIIDSILNDFVSDPRVYYQSDVNSDWAVDILDVTQLIDVILNLDE